MASETKLVFDELVTAGNDQYTSAEFAEWLGSGKVITLQVKAIEASGTLTVDVMHCLTGKLSDLDSFWTAWSGGDMSSGSFKGVKSSSADHGDKVWLKVSVSGQSASARIRIWAQVRDA